jgi:hypothetical protein
VKNIERKERKTTHKTPPTHVVCVIRILKKEKIKRERKEIIVAFM